MLDVSIVVLSNHDFFANRLSMKTALFCSANSNFVVRNSTVAMISTVSMKKNSTVCKISITTPQY